MSLVEVNQGTKLILEAIINKTAGQNLVLKLYKSNTTPAVGDTEASYTEATFTGYAAVTLAGASWTTASANPSTASYAAQTFTSTANQTAQIIYGYYLVQLASGKLIAAERFTSAVTIQNNTDSITVTPALTQASA